MTSEKARLAVSALAALMMLFVMTSASRVQARAGPKIVDMPSPTPTASATVTPSATPTSTSIPTITATAIPTATLEPVVEITTQYVVDRVMLWAPYAEEIIEQYEYDLDLALVLSVIAAESGGDQSVVSYAGAVGLMQVIDKPWYSIDPSGGPWGNMVLGMLILEAAIEIAEDRNLPFEYGIAFFNCSEQGVMTDECGNHGGLNYSDEVLNRWLPIFTERVSMSYD